MKQQTIYKITGMQQDVANSGMDKQHAYDIRNMRFRNSDTNTVTAVVNEPGNTKAVLSGGNTSSIRGTVIGYNTINDTGILFTHEVGGNAYVDPVDVSTALQSPVFRRPGDHIEDLDPDWDGGTGGSSTTSAFIFDIEYDNYVLPDQYRDVTIERTLTLGQSFVCTVSIKRVLGSDLNHNVVISTNSEFISLFPYGAITETDTIVLTPEMLANIASSPFKFRIVVSGIPEGMHSCAVNMVQQKEVASRHTTIGFSIIVPHVEPGGGDEPDPDPVPSYSDDVVCDYEEDTSTNKRDHIYLINVNEDGTLRVFEYFRGWLKFDEKFPIESTVYFENDEIQKVYWVDGKNPLRYANIAELNGDQPWNDNLMFDSVPLLHLQEEVTVTRNSTGGVFPSGSVQFAATYLNRYGAESNIFWISPIYYSCPDDRGGAPDELCANSFTINFSKYEQNGRFDYIRLYHIVHTTLDAEAEVRRVADIAIPTERSVEVTVDDAVQLMYPVITYTDTNTTGEAVDPNELLYLGGSSVIPYTLEQKSNTLFLGNLISNYGYLRKILNGIGVSGFGWGNVSSDDVEFVNASTDVISDQFSGYYSHENQLRFNSWQITGFRRGEEYRFGFQAQDGTGRWSDVWWLGDFTNEDKYPTYSNGTLSPVHAVYTLDPDIVSELRNAGYRRVRPVAVYPQVWERNVYTEGLLNPTVYNVKDRASNAPFAQSSWFLRPFSPIDLSSISLSGLSVDLDIDEFGNGIWGDSDQYRILLPETQEFLSGLTGSGNWDDQMPYLMVDSFLYHVGTSNTNSSLVDKSEFGSWAEFRHNHPLGDSQQRNGEVQSMYNPRPGYATASSSTLYSLRFPYTDSKKNFVNQYGDFFYVDQSILDMYSADIEFDSAFQATGFSDTAFRVTGLIPITAFISSYDIQTNTPPNKFFSKDNDSLLLPQGFYGSEIVGSRMSSTWDDVGHAWKSFISAAVWHDDLAWNTLGNTTSGYAGGSKNSWFAPIGFAVYPWQGQGSLNNDSVGSRREYPKDNDGKEESKSNTGDNYISAELKYKTIANMHYSYETYPITDITKSNVFTAKIGAFLDTQSVSLTKIAEPENSNLGTIHYFGNVDKLITPITQMASVDTIPGSTEDDDDENTPAVTIPTYDVTKYPLTRFGGYPKMVSYLPFFQHWEGASDFQSHLAFYTPYTPIAKFNTLTGDQDTTPEQYKLKAGADRTMSPIPIRYNSCNHLVVALDYESASIQSVIGWCGNNNNDAHSTGAGFWDNSKSYFKELQLFGSGYSFGPAGVWDQTGRYKCMEFGRTLSDTQGSGHLAGYLYMGQLIRTTPVPNKFGGNSDEALENNMWLPAGEAVYLSADDVVTLEWSAGDTYYQRYDALRTYPATEEDMNKVIDIVSFMTETHINIDGRYDKNRGLQNNNHVRPKNFNKLNYAYSQQDNFFTYQVKNLNKVNLDTFRYSFVWSQTKTASALRDEWTRVTLASSYDCDGNKGTLNRIVRLDNNLVAFQDGGVAQIMFNENVQIQGSEGVPIELANSGKMQGLRYYTTEVGCQNKWSIAVAPNGIYWVDGRNREFYMLGDGIIPVSTSKLMSTWFKNRDDSDKVWAPYPWTGFYTHNDTSTGELLLTTNDTCLCYDTVAGEFTSFYDYQGTDALFNIAGVVITAASDKRFVANPGALLNDCLWLHRSNKAYNCRFYNKQHPFWIEVVCNSNNQGNDYGSDKVFDNVSWRADAWQYLSSEQAWQYKPFVTFTMISGFTDYQTFASALNPVNGNAHNDSIPQLSYPERPAGRELNLRKKFKVWNTTIPRADATEDGHIRDRIRDTWCHLRLTADTGVSKYRHILHDIVISYFMQ